MHYCAFVIVVYLFCNLVCFFFQWASVASWFFRPECSLMSSMPKLEAPAGIYSMTNISPPNQKPCTTTSTSSSSTVSNATSSSIANSKQVQHEDKEERSFQPPTICTVSLTIYFIMLLVTFFLNYYI